MKFAMYFNVISMFFHLTGATTYSDGSLYVPLIKWVRTYYSTSAVFLMHSLSENEHFDENIYSMIYLRTVILLLGLKIAYMSHTWSRLLHREQIATLSCTFKDIHALKRNSILRPLVIIFLSGSEAVSEFSRYSKSLKMSLFAWFVIFITEWMDKKYCYNPSGNPFHLLFDTEMLVMCYGDPILREWYSVDGNNTVIFDLVKWYPERQVGSSTAALSLLTNLSLYERRNDLKGKVLRANSVLVKVKNNKFEGYFNRVISELENYLNFTLDIAFIEKEFGIFNTTTKSWNGAIRLVASGEADIGLADFSMTNIRLDYIDYMIPIFTLRKSFYFKQPEVLTVKWFAYYKVYSFTLWMSLLMTIMIALFVLAFIRSQVESTNLISEISHEFIRVWGIFCQQGITTESLFAEFPQNSSLRLAYFTILVTGIVSFAAYSASMICFVTARVRNIPFRTLQEFLDDDTYSIIVQRSSSDYDIFTVSLCLIMENSGTICMLSLLPVYICKDGSLTYYSGFNTKLRRTINYRIPCHVTFVDVGRVDSLSLILPKNSHMQKLLNSGLLNRLKSEVTFTEKTRFEPVGFYSIVSVLIIFLGGIILALVTLFIEIFYNRYINSYFYNYPDD
ncbi:unnamed protein product [Heterotrigona itama]|uniref:Ionotropic glutamate receptor L-glutamate and glycine-binding domain-containing protein n=1 Tax=Heterotrigona itama TaxID=395501 RepID=A0A6V7HIL1_9HYME|nr:unnamed protein product [Heterotrigona itama]